MIALIDVPTGGCFSDLIKLIASKPFCELLPPGCADGLNFAMLRDIRITQGGSLGQQFMRKANALFNQVNSHPQIRTSWECERCTATDACA